MSDVSLSSERSMAEDNAALKEKAAGVKDAVRDLAGETSRYVSNRASDAKDKASEWASRASDKAQSIGENIVDYVERNPYKAIGIAIGAGLLMGLILKRR